MNIRVDWVAENAADWLRSRAIALRADAGRDLADGYDHFYYDEIGLAIIAEKASRAEIANPPDKMLPCGICHGKVRCDIGVHRSIR